MSTQTAGPSPLVSLNAADLPPLAASRLIYAMAFTRSRRVLVTGLVTRYGRGTPSILVLPPLRANATPVRLRGPTLAPTQQRPQSPN